MPEEITAGGKAQGKAVILIPSLEPDDRLPAYIESLISNGFGRVVVVDDGSPQSYQHIFERIAGMPSATVLHHDVNHGKGVALKTGYQWIAENLPEVSGVITADADGQHSIEDCIHLAEELEKGQRALYLGARDFSQPNVPPKSKSGNRFTSITFKLLYGQWLNDTQTGLRAFRREDLDFMTGIEGERFEYEMNVLIACVRHNLPIVSIPIETIYENANSGTHYHPFRDSMRIFKVLVLGFIKFMGASLLSTLVDQVVFNVMNLAVFHNGDAKAANLILISTATARVISATVNFLLNKKFVFRLKGNSGKAAWKYAALCVAVMLASAGGVWALGQTGMNSTLAKIIVDVLLYFINYRVQAKWVFA